MAEIEIQDQLHARIESGLLAFICFEPADSIQTLDSFIKKIENFYFFEINHIKISCIFVLKFEVFY